MARLALLLCVPVALWRDRGFFSYWLRNPGAFDARALRDVAVHDLLPVAEAAVLALACAGLGARVLRRLLPGERPDGARPFSFALGLAALGWCAFVLGLAGLLTPAALGALAAAALLAADLRAAIPERPKLPRLDAAAALASGAMGLAAFNALVTALAPATAWDVLAYHLALPKIYLKEGRALELPWLIHGHWPHLMEAFYALPLALGSDAVAALTHAAACAALTAAIWLAARRELGEKAAWISASLFAAQPALHMVAGTAHNDGALALFVFLSVWAAYEWKETSRDGWLAVSCLLAGAAACAKLHGLVVAATLAGLVALRSPRRAAAFFATAFALASPWYLRSALATGDPFWPLLGGRFGAAAVAADLLRSSRWSWPLQPSLLLSFGPQYSCAALAALFLLAARGERKPPPLARFGLLIGIPYFLAVVRQRDAWRFLLPFIPFLCVAAGAYAAKVPRGWRRAAALAAILVGVWPSLSVDENNELFAVAALRSRARPDASPRELYLERTIDDYRLMREASRTLPPASKVLLFREIRGYYLDAAYQWGDPLNQGLVRYSELASPARLRARLEELGITHVLVDRGLAMYRERPDYYDARTLALMDGALAGAAPVLVDGDAALYKLP